MDEGDGKNSDLHKKLSEKLDGMLSKVKASKPMAQQHKELVASIKRKEESLRHHDKTKLPAMEERVKVAEDFLQKERDAQLVAMARADELRATLTLEREEETQLAAKMAAADGGAPTPAAASLPATAPTLPPGGVTVDAHKINFAVEQMLAAGLPPAMAAAMRAVLDSAVLQVPQPHPATSIAGDLISLASTPGPAAVAAYGLAVGTGGDEQWEEEQWEDDDSIGDGFADASASQVDGQQEQVQLQHMHKELDTMAAEHQAATESLEQQQMAQLEAARVRLLNLTPQSVLAVDSATPEEFATANAIVSGEAKGPGKGKASESGHRASPLY